jgi:hypothetical protein
MIKVADYGKWCTDSYKDLVEANLKDEANKLGNKNVNILVPKNFLFMQDGDTVHRSAKMKKWFKKNKIQLMEWTPCSADMVSIFK